ncbi:MAG: YHS domain-containing protein [Gammaproteobacteria bacterium]|nr:YHS domain-containing protein [Gammaproteobacteria bacterium]
MEKDPVCGMLMGPKQAAAQRVHEGRTYYFCSTECLKKSDQAPARYVAVTQSHAKKDHP